MKWEYPGQFYNWLEKYWGLLGLPSAVAGTLLTVLFLRSEPSPITEFITNNLMLLGLLAAPFAVYLAIARDHLLYQKKRLREQERKEQIALMRPVLSAIPKTSRPFINAELVGRERELNWLKETKDDRILIGHSGSGKTFLLASLTRNGWGLFVVEEDIDKILRELREHQPAIIILDDAHFKLEFLSKLIHLRASKGLSFSIIATSWPGGRDEVIKVLTVPNSQGLELPLLKRDEIVTVIKGVGLAGPDRLIREIVDQSEGRPGLAVTLTYICFQGDVKDVALGDAIIRMVRTDFQKLIDPGSADILAAFSIGGDGGMRLDQVADKLGLSLVEIGVIVSGLAAGGLIKEVSRTRERYVYLSVTPRTLRHALVRDSFFNSVARLPYQSLLEIVPNISELVITLIGAKACGADIGLNELVAILEKSNSISAWRQFASLGPEESKLVLERHPELAVELSGPLLHFDPETTIPLLLDAAIGDERPLHSNPEHPLRLLEDWVKDSEPNELAAVVRRKILLDSAFAWIKAGNDETVGSHALTFVLLPQFDRSSTDPGLGMTVTIRFGPLSLDRLEELCSLWPSVLDVIRMMHAPTWRFVLEMLSTWAYANYTFEIGSDTKELMRKQTSRMIADLIVLAEGQNGVLRQMKTICKSISLKVEVPLDSTFEVLFPLDERGDYQTIFASQAVAVRKLAAEWNNAEPPEIAKRIIEFEKSAGVVENTAPRLTPLLGTELAKLANPLSNWLKAFLDASVPADVLAPLLNEVVLRKEAGWNDFLETSLDMPQYQPIAISILITQKTPEPELLDKALGLLSDFTYLIWIHCLRGNVPEPTLEFLLAHEDPQVACSAAIGEWSAEPEGSVRQNLVPTWHSAIRRYITYLSQQKDQQINRNSSIYHQFTDILESDPGFAFEWIMTRLSARPKVRSLVLEDIDEIAVKVLSTEQRIKVLETIPPDYDARSLIYHLIGDDLQVYAFLLKNNALSSFHLAPLSGKPVGVWIEKARLAFENGYSHQQITQAALSPVGTSILWGPESAMWCEWIIEFTKLCSHNSEGIKKIGEIGLEIVNKRRDKALQQERKEQVFGF